MGDSVQYYQPGSLADAVDRLKEADEAKIVAGGQSMMPLLRQGLISPDALVDITEIPDLDAVTVTDGTVEIGALVTYSELLETEICADLDLLSDAVKAIGDVPVRNAGTIGGGVSHADPAQDLPPALQCLDAKAVSFDGDETRHHDLSEFFLDYYLTELEPHEIVTGIKFERPPARAGGAYASDTEAPGGWSTAGVAALIVPDADDGETCTDAQLAYCAGAPVPKRVPEEIESQLVGDRIDRETVDEVAMAIVEDLELIDDVDDDVEYRKHLFRVMTKRAITTALRRSDAPPLTEPAQ
ncbi:xanthine dehydrogenase family protein subunit M [Natronomonas gomsonensis]|jgi:CO/xanthine dehydrogenase FAD-binding subunit|uniref:FAD binding domain-containing protein n=1 Tax=Natronomonas gomsonensis TaxID=1046043 RepID=UPI0020CA4D42|nr:xanthine dehydrogenase family protein subunit M [Natronomonas gomsonensis]MCY4730007.1 xanthine dehydrogenase family protein subunit M [Natronomonas gomsonensis]